MNYFSFSKGNCGLCWVRVYSSFALNIALFCSSNIVKWKPKHFFVWIADYRLWKWKEILCDTNISSGIKLQILVQSNEAASIELKIEHEIIFQCILLDVSFKASSFNSKYVISDAKCHSNHIHPDKAKRFTATLQDFSKKWREIVSHFFLLQLNYDYIFCKLFMQLSITTQYLICWANNLLLVTSFGWFNGTWERQCRIYRFLFIGNFIAFRLICKYLLAHVYSPKTFIKIGDEKKGMIN